MTDQIPQSGFRELTLNDQTEYFLRLLVPGDDPSVTEAYLGHQQGVPTLRIISEGDNSVRQETIWQFQVSETV